MGSVAVQCAAAGAAGRAGLTGLCEWQEWSGTMGGVCGWGAWAGGRVGRWAEGWGSQRRGTRDTGTDAIRHTVPHQHVLHPPTPTMLLQLPQASRLLRLQAAPGGAACRRPGVRRSTHLWNRRFRWVGRWRQNCPVGWVGGWSGVRTVSVTRGCDPWHAAVVPPCFQPRSARFLPSPLHTKTEGLTSAAVGESPLAGGASAGVTPTAAATSAAAALPDLLGDLLSLDEPAPAPQAPAAAAAGGCCVMCGSGGLSLSLGDLL